jgi:hypothetical protein
MLLQDRLKKFEVVGLAGRKRELELFHADVLCGLGLFPLRIAGLRMESHVCDDIEWQGCR